MTEEGKTHRYEVPAEQCDHDWTEWMNAFHTNPAGGEEMLQMRWCKKCRASEVRELS